jgi:hypothetical protein
MMQCIGSIAPVVTGNNVLHDADSDFESASDSTLLPVTTWPPRSDPSFLPWNAAEAIVLSGISTKECNENG